MKYLGLLFITLFTISASGQTLPSYKISYKFSISDELKNIDLEKEKDESKRQLAMTAALASAFSENENPISEAWINEKFIRVNNNLFDSSYQLINKETEDSYIIYPDSKQYTQNYITSVLHTDNISSEDLHIKYINNKTKNIAGYTCKFAQMTIAEDNNSSDSIHTEKITVDIWYTEELPKLYWGEYHYLTELPGAMLAVSTMGIGIEASAVIKENQQIAFFEIPSDYQQLEGNIITSYAMSDNYITDNRYIFIDSVSDMYGIMDSLKNSIVKPIYTNIYTFYENIAVATDVNYEYGAIDSDGNIIVPFIYEELSYDDINQIFLYKENDKYGFLRKDGSVYMKAKYEELNYMQHGLVVFGEKGKYGILDDKENIIAKPIHDNIVEVSQGTNFITTENDLYVLYDLKTNHKIGESYEYLSYANEDDLFLARKNSKYGYINSKGETTIPFKYNYASTFYGGLAPVTIDDDSEVIYINAKGENMTKNTSN